MFFSILIPAYNKEAYVARCLDSVVGQGYNDFEIIFVDDGSTDRTLEVASLYEDNRLRIIHTDNRGVSSARNSAIEASAGRYLLFLDADDAFAPNYIQRVFDDIVSSEYPDILIGGLVKVSETFSKQITPAIIGKFDNQAFRSVFIREMMHNEGLPGYIANKAVSRNYVLNYGLSFDPSIKLAEDLDFWVACYRFAESIVVSDNIGYLYFTGTPGSSIYDRDVDYISQLYIWDKIRDFASSANPDILHYFDSKFSGYAVSAFNELKDVSKGNVANILRSINEHHSKTPYKFIDSGQPLSFLINLGSVNLIYYYLRLRKIVHDKRNHTNL